MNLHHIVVRHLLKKPMSISDLQLSTQVSLPTLNKVLRDLTEARWVCAAGFAEANGGRPATLFGIDDSYFMILGCHFQLPGIRLVASSLTGQILDEAKTFHDVVPQPDEAIDTVMACFTKYQDAFPERLILGMGIAAPGFIDLNTGDIVSIGRVPSWKNLPICQRLRAATEVPVIIANDVDCMAIAEFMYSGQALDKNLAYVGFDEGVKVSLFLNGELYKGSLGNTGLISSELLNAGDLSNEEEAKSLLTVIGVNQTFERRLAEKGREKNTPCASVLGTSNYRQRFRLIMEYALEENSICHGIVQEMIGVVSAAIANVMYIVQPDVVVIGGLLGSLPPTLFANLEAAIRKHLPTLVNYNTVIKQGKLASRNCAVKGAMQHFLQEYLNDSSLFLH